MILTYREKGKKKVFDLKNLMSLMIKFESPVRF